MRSALRTLELARSGIRKNSEVSGHSSELLRVQLLELVLIADAVVAALLGNASPAHAEKIRVNQQAADLVVLKDGTRLQGAVVARGKDGALTVAIQREWLKKHAAGFYAAAVREEQRRIAEAPIKRLERIRDWLKQRAGEKDLAPFLKSELARLEKVPAKPQAAAANAATQLMLVVVPGKDVKGGFRQPAAHRQVLLLAWRERLKDVERRRAADLAKELRDSGTRFDGRPVDLSDRLPKSAFESDAQWAARKAVVEFDRLKRLRFQGTGDVLVRAGGDSSKPVDLSQLFSSLLQAQLNKLLQEALGNGVAPRRKKTDDALRKAIETAESEKVAGFRVTRVKPDLSAKRITVEENFVARMPGGAWETVWSHRETLDASQKRPEIEKRIKNDDRVKQALALVKGLGAGANDDQLETAIRFGAATQLAQEKAEEIFDDFRNRFSRRLDAAPLRWSGR
jgi:hypothetical protein